MSGTGQVLCGLEDDMNDGTRFAQQLAGNTVKMQQYSKEFKKVWQPVIVILEGESGGKHLHIFYDCIPQSVLKKFGKAGWGVEQHRAHLGDIIARISATHRIACAGSITPRDNPPTP